MTVKLFGSALLLLLSLHIGNAAPVNQRLSDAKLPPDEVNEAELDAYKDAALEFVKVFNDDLAKIEEEEEEEEEKENEVTSLPFDDDDDSDEDEDEDEPEVNGPFGDEDYEKPAQLVVEVIEETRTTKSAIDHYEDEGDDEEVVEVIKVDPKKGSKNSDPHIVAIEDKNAGQDNGADKNDLLLAALAAEDHESEDDGEVIEVIKSNEHDETEDYESEEDEVVEVIKAEDHDTEDSSSDDNEVIEVVKVDPKKGSKHSNPPIVETILEKPVPEAKLKPTEKTTKKPSEPKEVIEVIKAKDHETKDSSSDDNEEVIEVIKAKDHETEDSSSDDNEEVIEVIKAEDPETEDSSSDDNKEVIEVVKVEPKVESEHNNPHSADLSSEDDEEIIEVLKAVDHETEDSSSDDDEEVIEVVKVEPKVGSKPNVDPRIAGILSELDAAGERAVNEIEWESQNILDAIRDEAEMEVERLLHKDASGSDAKRYA